MVFDMKPLMGTIDNTIEKLIWGSYQRETFLRFQDHYGSKILPSDDPGPANKI